MSEWLLFNASSAIFQLYRGENKLIFYEMMMMFTLYNTLSWISIVLAHWSNRPRKDMSLHSDTLSWFRANQSLLSREATNINFIVFGLTRPGIEPRIYRTLTITPPMRFCSRDDSWIIAHTFRIKM